METPELARPSPFSFCNGFSAGAPTPTRPKFTPKWLFISRYFPVSQINSFLTDFDWMSKSQFQSASCRLCALEVLTVAECSGPTPCTPPTPTPGPLHGPFWAGNASFTLCWTSSPTTQWVLCWGHVRSPMTQKNVRVLRTEWETKALMW